MHTTKSIFVTITTLNTVKVHVLSARMITNEFIKLLCSIAVTI